MERQLRMVWSRDRGIASLRPLIPTGYSLRLFRAGDEKEFFRIMESAGWPGWDADRLGRWTDRLLPAGWFIIEEHASRLPVATAMALRDTHEFGVQGGELGWLACHEAHRGRGLGVVASAAVTRRFIEEGYRWIHLYTEDHRLAALKIYLSLGYIPLIEDPDLLPRWRVACERVGWIYNPSEWSALFERR